MVVANFTLVNQATTTMDTILVPVDFSANAGHAAEYAYYLAKQLKADMVLCNAVLAPSQIPQAGVIVWPIEEYHTLLEGSNDELTFLKQKLEKADTSTDFRPEITFLSEAGYLPDVVNGLAKDMQVDMTVMGTHCAGGLSTFIFGNHSRKMIDATTGPLMIVPQTAVLQPIRKIAFATDLTKTADDEEAVFALIPFAMALNAEILITYVYNGGDGFGGFQNQIDQFMTVLSNKANYPKIYYRIVTDSNTEAGLDWLCHHGQIDILAVVHRQHNFFDNLIKGSHTKKLSEVVEIPLLVLPEMRR